MRSAARELVLGGEGLIGSALCEALRDRGHDAVSLDLRTGCDLREAGEQSFAECDRVWFLAWATGGSRYLQAGDRQHEILRHNSELCARVFDALERSGRPFLFTSSQLAGQPDAYGTTKLLGEVWTRQLGGQVARLWNVFGWEPPGARSHVVTDFVFSALRQGRIDCLTTGRERRRLLYKSDGVEALLALADSDRASADVAGPRWVAIREVAEEIARQTGAQLAFGDRDGGEVMGDPGEPPPGWRPQVSLEDGIARVIEEARR